MNTESEPEFDYQAYMRSLPPRGGEGEPDPIKIHRGPEARQKRRKTAAYCNSGNTKGVLGRHEEAIADYDEALRMDPQLAAAYYNRGNAKGLLGRHEEAIADYDKALQIDPQLAAAYYSREAARIALQRTSLAP